MRSKVKLQKRLDSIRKARKRIVGIPIAVSTDPGHIKIRLCLTPRQLEYRNWCLGVENDLQRKLQSASRRERKVKDGGQPERANDIEANIPAQPRPTNDNEVNVPGQPGRTDDNEVNDPYLIPLSHRWYKRVLTVRRRGDYAFIRTGDSLIHNRGVIATRKIGRNTIIVEHTGEIISVEEQNRREEAGLGGYFCALATPDRVIDGRFRGNVGRYFNHSCDPNTTLQLLTFENGDFAVVVSAKKNIGKGTELTYDYGYTQDGNRVTCNCGSKKCRRFINI